MRFSALELLIEYLLAEEINRVHNSQYNAATHNPNTFVDELFFRIKKP